MKNRKFLVPLAALAAVFVSGHSDANTNNSPVVVQTAEQNTQDTALTNKVEIVQDQFSFILKPANSGNQTAWNDHESHYSHESHASHASHRSHASGY